MRGVGGAVGCAGGHPRSLRYLDADGYVVAELRPFEGLGDVDAYGSWCVHDCDGAYVTTDVPISGDTFCIGSVVSRGRTVKRRGCARTGTGTGTRHGTSISRRIPTPPLARSRGSVPQRDDLSRGWEAHGVVPASFGEPDADPAPSVVAESQQAGKRAGKHVKPIRGGRDHLCPRRVEPEGWSDRYLLGRQGGLDTTVSVDGCPARPDPSLTPGFTSFDNQSMTGVQSIPETPSKMSLADSTLQVAPVHHLPRAPQARERLSLRDGQKHVHPRLRRDRLDRRGRLDRRVRPPQFPLSRGRRRCGRPPQFPLSQGRRPCCGRKPLRERPGHPLGPADKPDTHPRARTDRAARSC